MAEIRFRKNNTEYHLDFRGINAPCEHQLAFVYGGNTYYVPAMSTQGTKVFGGIVNGYSWYYDTSSPTIAFRKNGKTYYCSKSLTTEKNEYDILAGTYSPSTFEDLISSFISRNGSRNVKNSFTVTVNGQTYNVPSGRAICYTSQYAGTCRFITFSGSQRTSEQFENNQFSTQGVYCVYWLNRGAAGSGQGNTYSNYNITVNTGIKFS